MRLPNCPRRIRPLRATLVATLALGLSAADNQRKPSAAEAITSAELRRDVRFLASPELAGRKPGLPGHQMAAGYAAKRLQEAGLQPVFTDEPSVASFLQPVPLVRYRFGPNNRLTVRNRDHDLTFPHGGENYLLASPGKPNASVPTGPPVFVGYGIHDPEHGWDDYANLTVRNRVVILLDGLPAEEKRSGMSLPAETRRQYAGSINGPRKKLDTVSAMGAAGVVVVPGKRALAGWDGLARHQRQFDFAAAEPYPGEQPESPVPVLVAHPRLLKHLFNGRDYDPVDRKGDYRTFVLDGIELELQLDVAREPLTTHNVVAMVRGSDPALREEYVVLSAHLDHLGTDGGAAFPGANDDASGCAALLEVAGAVAASPHERSVIFALFSAEEAGRLGSLHFLAHPPVQADRIVANVNLEQVGRKNAELEGFWVVGSDSLKPPLDSAVRRAVGSRVQFETAESRMPVFRSSDNFSFYARGIPSLLVSGGGFPEYHSAGDTPERVDFEYLHHASLFAYVVIMELASPRWPSPAPLPPSRNPTLDLNLMF